MSRLHSYLSPSSAAEHGNGLVDPTQIDEVLGDSVGYGVQDGAGSGGLWEAPPSIGIPHRLFVPEHYESRYEYPLFVWLHSDHSSEYELDSVMQSLSVRNYIAVGLRGNRSSSRSSQVYRWGNSLTDYALNEECVFHAIEELAGSLSIDKSRVFLGGFGKGAMVAQWVGLRNPGQIAGVVSCNGPFPSNKRSLAQWKQARSLPVLAMQSSDSNRFGVDQVIHMMKTAHHAGLNYRLIRFEAPAGQPSDLLGDSYDPSLDPEYEGSLEVEMLKSANRFMMGIVTGEEMPLLTTLSTQDHSLWPQ